ncbi:putative aldehyde dehydrogenase [Aspergillus insuetus]
MSFIQLAGRDGDSFQVPTGLFIDNSFLPSKEGAELEVLNPLRGAAIGNLSAAQPSDVDAAVISATRAFESSWKQTTPVTRGSLLLRLADLIERDQAQFATIHSIDAGFVYDDVLAVDIPQSISTLRYYAGWAGKLCGKNIDFPGGFGITRREPFGVCAAIIPWNAPLMVTIWKLAPAIAAGNVLIIKSPELAPIYGQKLAELIVESGFPAGVVNILCGQGSVAGSAIAHHMGIRKVAFTGSTLTGRSVLRASADSNLKKVSLELGGKSPSIVFDDADLDNALQWTLLGSTANNGQICALGSRIYVQAGIYDAFLREFKARVESLSSKQGDPLAAGVNKGPIISGAQYKKIATYIDGAKDEGAQLLTGGASQAIGSSGFVQNTYFTDVREDMTVVKHEVFGPVSTIHRFSTEDEVIRKANASDYGLSAAVFTENVHTASRVAQALEAGHVTVNVWAMMVPNMPFGGVKQSGFGRDLGEDALDEWTYLKAVKYAIRSGSGKSHL